MTRRHGPPAWLGLAGQAGLGGSDYQRQCSVSGWAGDLTALAGHLGLDHFALAGESGGAPFTLTAAHQLAGRVTAVAPDRVGRPIGPAERAGQKARNRIMGWLAGHAPALNTIQVAAMRRELANPACGLQNSVTRSELGLRRLARIR